MGKPTQPHICWGCNEPIGSGEPHIHITLDEWGRMQGLSSLGLDDLFTFPFCKPCTIESPRGWQLEAHEVTAQVAGGGGSR